MTRSARALCAACLALVALVAVVAMNACRQPLGSASKPLDLGRGVFVTGLLRPGQPLWADFRVDALGIYTFSVQPPLPGVSLQVLRRRPVSPPKRGFERFGEPLRGVPHVGPLPMQSPAEHRDVLLTPDLYSVRVNATVKAPTDVLIDISQSPAPEITSVEPRELLLFEVTSKSARVRLEGRALREDFAIRIGAHVSPLRVLRDGSEALFEIEREHIAPENPTTLELVLVTPWSERRLPETILARTLPGPARAQILGLDFRELPSGAAAIGPSSEGVALVLENDAEAEPDEGEPRSYVQPPGCWMSATEVTQEVWEAVQLQNLSPRRGARLPAHGITHASALELCRRFTALAAERDPRWSGFEFDLPTEEEWEFAARAFTRTPIAVPVDPGDETPFPARLADYAWFVESSRTHPDGAGPYTVAGKAPNPFGLYDVHGNVFEWCRASESLPPPPAGHGVLRGGCYATTYRGCRVSNRDFEPLDVANRRIGLRLIARPPQKR